MGLWTTILAGCVVALAWYRSPPRAAKATCQKYVSLLAKNNCTDAYRLTVQSTYSFSTLETFCRDNRNGSDNFDLTAASCDDGEWHGTELVMFGSVRRRTDQHTVPFGMRMRRQADDWLVVDLGLDD